MVVVSTSVAMAEIVGETKITAIRELNLRAGPLCHMCFEHFPVNEFFLRHLVYNKSVFTLAGLHKIDVVLRRI